MRRPFALLLLSAAATAQVAAGALGAPRAVAAGLALRQAAAADAQGRPQFVSVLQVDPTAPGVHCEFALADGLDETSDMARRAGATAAVNAGFFTKERTADGALRVSGREIAGARPARAAALVLDDPRQPAIADDPRGQFDGARTLLAAGPLLLDGGELPAARQWNDQRHPRTAVGLLADGSLLLVTVDGRADQAAGMTLVELATTLHDLGCVRAMNLDGGGSTTLWLAGAPGTGVVNHPCDDKVFDAAGERAVANAVLVFAGPLRAEPAAPADELARRTARDFSLSRESLLQQLDRRLLDFRPAEFDGWLQQGLIDHRERDGVQWFARPTVSNLFFRDAGARARRRSGATWTMPVLDTTARTFAIELRLTVRADAVPAGETVRAWLPFPQRDDRQRLLTDDAAVPDAPMRALYQEQVAEAGKPVVFTTSFAFERRGVRTADLDPARALPVATAAFTDQRPPHVVFTPEIRALAAKVAGDEPNPLRAARRFYDWCADQLCYSYAREYSTIAAIPEELLATRRGDCGQSTLLFMTLCRCRGIPCRWQSGWVLLPGHENMHDWCEICVPPWGWIPVDVNTAIELRSADRLAPGQRQLVRDFFFGGIDSYRFVCNRDHGRALVPDKQSPRSDDVDFQRGEVEWGTPPRNVWFADFDLDLVATERR